MYIAKITVDLFVAFLMGNLVQESCDVLITWCTEDLWKVIEGRSIS